MASSQDSSSLPVEKKNEEGGTTSPAPPGEMCKSSSSGSLLLLPNKRDSPSKTSRKGSLPQSASTGNLRMTPQSYNSPADKRPSCDAATILESLKKDEMEMTLKSSASSGSLAKKSLQPQEEEEDVVVATTTQEENVPIVVETTEEEALLLNPIQVDTTPSPQKKALKLPASRKDSPKTPEGEKRTPRVSLLAQDIATAKDQQESSASPNTMEKEHATLETLRQISASPVSDTSSTDAEAAKEWLTEPTASPQKKSSPREATSSSPAASKAPLTRSGGIPREPSLQWHEGPQTSSRVIQAPEPSGLLPSPPSMRITNSTPPKRDEVVAVFNANTVEGKSMVRALAKSGSQVVAIVRVFTSRNTKSLLKLGKNVVVKVADSHDEAALAKAVDGAHRAFLVTTYWDRFDSALEEKQAFIVLNTCASQNVHHLVLSSFEDTKVLREKGLVSQIVPRKDGTITPTFEGMAALKEAAKKLNVQLTHMITSYLDQENSKKSLCLIVGENGNLIVNSHIPEED